MSSRQFYGKWYNWELLDTNLPTEKMHISKNSFLKLWVQIWSTFLRIACIVYCMVWFLIQVGMTTTSQCPIDSYLWNMIVNNNSWMGSHTAFCSSQPNNTRTSLISGIRNEICALERVQCAHAQCARKNYGTLRRRNPAGKSGTSGTTAMLRSHNPYIHIPSLSDRKRDFQG